MVMIMGNNNLIIKGTKIIYIIGGERYLCTDNSLGVLQNVHAVVKLQPAKIAKECV